MPPRRHREVEANLFAIELLTPASLVADLWAQGNSERTISRLLQVPADVIARRIDDLRLGRAAQGPSTMASPDRPSWKPAGGAFRG